MILWKFKETLETRGNDMPCSAFRWVFEIDASRDGFNIGFVHQHQDKMTREWNSSHTAVYEITGTRYFKLGSQHVYYDGPHCSFSLGFIHFVWGGGIRTNWCKKCHPG